VQRVRGGMAIFGYHASHEQLPPSRLLACVQLAEQAGFQAAMCSDHFAPWSTTQGHSGFAWSWLGAALQVHLAYADDEATALGVAREQWANGALDGSLCWELELPEQFEAATRHVRPDDLRDAVLVAADPGRLAEALAGYVELGFDAIHLHEVGRDQRRSIELLGGEVLPRLAPVVGRVGA
jgi:alkanesulfonate monooxygenase SsuD/methylene tetrahydromethanopterin reductase-like flavin-dependent oxidoreductase (luciferase family)